MFFFFLQGSGLFLKGTASAGSIESIRGRKRVWVVPSEAERRPNGWERLAWMRKSSVFG